MKHDGREHDATVAAIAFTKIANPNGSPLPGGYFNLTRLFHANTSSGLRSRTLAWRSA